MLTFSSQLFELQSEGESVWAQVQSSDLLSDKPRRAPRYQEQTLIGMLPTGEVVSSGLNKRRNTCRTRDFHDEREIQKIHKNRGNVSNNTMQFGNPDEKEE